MTTIITNHPFYHTTLFFISRFRRAGGLRLAGAPGDRSLGRRPWRAWRGGKENRGKPQEAARWLPGHGGPVSHVPGFLSHRALAARPDSLVLVSWSPRRLRAPPAPGTDVTGFINPPQRGLPATPGGTGRFLLPSLP